MPRCCGSASCSCVIQEGSHIQVEGTGGAGDPFIITGDIGVDDKDNATFNVDITGLGTVAQPWVFEVLFAGTARLNDFPDVNAPTPTNGQVLGWNTAQSQWTPQNPTTAAAGSVQHDTSLAGDGSAGTPLQVQEDPAAFLTTRAPGLGVSDAGINQMTRKFPNIGARNAASPTPTLNTLSLVDSAPGQIDYYTGTEWKPAGGAFLLGNVSGQEFYQLSGPYTGGRLTVVVRNILTTTDNAGLFTVFDATELAGKAGIMSITTQVIFGASPTPYIVQVEGVAGGVRGHAFRADDGTAYALGTVSIIATGFIY